jgi:predicted nucleic acid-binding protein
VTLVLDSGAVSALALDRPRLKALRKYGQWPPIVPAAVLVESLTGDHRLDFHANRLLRLCEILPVTETLARHAAVLRSASRRKGISVVDAVVVATADHVGGAVILTGDPVDLAALAAHAVHTVRVAPVS